MALVAIGWIAVAAASSESRYHTYVTVSSDGVVVSEPALVQLSRQTAHFEEPGVYYAELTLNDLGAERCRFRIVLFEFEGGPEVTSMERETDGSEFIAVLTTGPFKSAQEFELRIHGYRFP